jgi:RNA polymerase sigma factor (sigma-70 family)
MRCRARALALAFGSPPRATPSVAARTRLGPRAQQLVARYLTRVILEAIMTAFDAKSDDSDATQALARRAASGDAASLEALYRRVAPSLCAWARLRLNALPGVGMTDGDVAQEVWVRALQARARWAPDTVSFRAFVFRIAKHVLLEAMRQRGTLRGAGVGGTVALAGIGAAPDEVSSITAQVARSEAVQRLTDLIASLDADDRKLALHCGFEDLSLAETAQQMGLSYEAVTKRWQRLRARLREASHLIEV